MTHLRYIKYLLLALVGMVSLGVLSAQPADSTAIVLPVVHLHDMRLSDLSTGQTVTSLDSTLLASYQADPLEKVLQENTPVFIKSYGTGNLATTSFRGTGASHTAVYWQGLPINSPSLGLTDFSLIPTSFFDGIAILSGGGSTLYGSGAIGGSVHFNSLPVFKKRSDVSLGQKIGSYGLSHSSITLKFSDKKWFSKTLLTHRNATNDFPYTNTVQLQPSEDTLANAAYAQYALLQEFTLRLGQKMCFPPISGTSLLIGRSPALC